MVPGTFWYDFLTGPSLGGVGALCAALIIGGTTLRSSKDRRRDAEGDRTVEQLRTGREEWFRRVQWGQQLSVNDAVEVRAAGFGVLRSLARSRLASDDDLELLKDMSDTAFLRGEAEEGEEALQWSDYEEVDQRSDQGDR